MPHCYVLTQTGGDSCGRGGFLIHGGSCGADPSEGAMHWIEPIRSSIALIRVAFPRLHRY